MTEIKCPICSSGDTELKIVSKDYLVLKGDSEEFSVYFCNDCHNGFSFPFLTNAELNRHYPDNYNCYSSQKGFIGRIQRIKSGNDVRIIEKFLKNTGKELFEVGSGSGFFLSLLAEKGLKVSGLEPSLSGVKYAKENFSIELEHCFFENFIPENKFDMLIAFHVLEHFTDPVSALRKMKSMIKEGGFLYVKVPRLDSWPAKLYGKFWHGYDLPRHRSHFTKKGLTDLLEKEGFETIMLKGDYGPLDTVRAIDYFSKFSNNKPLKYLFKTVNILPYIIKLIAATAFEIITSPFKSGRMSIIVKKVK